MEDSLSILQEHQFSCDEPDESQTKASSRRVQVLTRVQEPRSNFMIGGGILRGLLIFAPEKDHYKPEKYISGYYPFVENDLVYIA